MLALSFRHVALDRVVKVEEQAQALRWMVKLSKGEYYPHRRVFQGQQFLGSMVFRCSRSRQRAFTAARSHNPLSLCQRPFQPGPELGAGSRASDTFAISTSRARPSE
jgi:hypothetical protein